MTLYTANLIAGPRIEYKFNKIIRFFIKKLLKTKITIWGELFCLNFHFFFELAPIIHVFMDSISYIFNSKN